MGSFFNVAVWRIPRKQSVVSPGSRCPGCGHAIPWYRNLPVLTWILQRGKCAWCGFRIPVFYVLVEALCGVLAVVSVWLTTIGWTRDLAFGWGVFALFSVPIALIDWEHFEIPDGLVASAFAFGVFVRTFFAQAPADGFLDSIRGALLAAGGLYALHFFARVILAGWGRLVRALRPRGVRWHWRRGWRADVLLLVARWSAFDDDMEALGLGDVTLGLAAGACLGAPSVLLGLGPAAFLGVGGYFWRKGHPRSAQIAEAAGVDPLAIPFGPFLAAGFLLSAWLLHSGYFQF
ncbi:MAG: prepilin peptidase [Fibrobacteres bacterium]|nr:prepilin peptidase [Fibrobacterota bacterium]